MTQELQVNEVAQPEKNEMSADGEENVTGSPLIAGDELFYHHWMHPAGSDSGRRISIIKEVNPECQLPVIMNNGDCMSSSGSSFTSAIGTEGEAED